MAVGRFERERKLHAAMAWLAGQLADGQPRMAGGLLEEGVAAGYAERTLQRASVALGVKKTPTYNRRGQHEGVLWKLAKEPAKHHAP